MGWVTQKTFASILGVSAPAVCQAVKRGRLDGATRTNDAGRVEIHEENGVLLWGQNNARPDLSGQQTGPKSTKVVRKITTAPPKDKPAPKTELPGEDVNEEELPEVAISRKRTEHFKALQAELDYRVDAKQYVLIEDVANQVEKEYTAVSRRLRAIKVTLSAELLEVFGDANLVELETLIDSHINEALTELSNPHADGAFATSAVNPTAAAKA